MGMSSLPQSFLTAPPGKPREKVPASPHISWEIAAIPSSHFSERGEIPDLSPPMRPVNPVLAVPPVSFPPKPASRPMDPMSSNPYCVWARWSRPIAMNPHVALPVPPLIARDPNKMRSRWRRTPFHHAWRRPDAHKNLSVGHTCAQHRSSHSRQQKFLHACFYLLICRQSAGKCSARNARRPQP
jgi:hypothetical protein